jgi:hypothetical protein
MNSYDYYIYLIFSVKIIFILLTISYIYFKIKGNTDLDKNILYWKERVEFIFVCLMSILLIYIFNPRLNKEFIINSETRLLLYLFGFILLITAQWDIFIEESKWFEYLQELFGKN